MTDFTLRSDDLGLLQRALIYNLRGSWLQRALRFGLSVVGGLFLGGAAAAFKRAYDCCSASQSSLVQVLVLTAAGIATFIALAIWNKVRMSRAALSKDGWFLSPQSVTFTEEGMDHITKLGRSHITWSSLLGRREDRYNYYLLVEPCLGIIIPKAPLSDAERELIRTRVAGEV
jgi:hypothetical protein